MPLFRQAPFERKRIPKSIYKNTPLYYLDMTGEAFIDYEEYCYRIIQCNSLVWTCAVTGRTDLTFTEAEESEENAKYVLEYFPMELRVPALYLTSIAQCPNFQELVSHVLNFMKEHFFVGEIVEPTIKCEWKLGKIIKVKNPRAKLQSSKKLQQYTPPTMYEYNISACVNGKSMEMKLTGAQLKRRDDTWLTESMLSVFLESNAVLDFHGIWVIKGSVLQQYDIQCLKFHDIFCGDPPVFTEIPKASRSGKGMPKQRRAKSSQNVEVGKLSGQQNIEQYFVTSKKSAPVLSNKSDTGSDEEVDFHSKSESAYVVNISSDEETVDLGIKSETASIMEIWSEDESGSSGDEIKVVWASTVRPNMHAMKNLYQKTGKVIGAQDCVIIKQEPDDIPNHPSLKEKENDISLEMQLLKKKHKSVDDLESPEKGVGPPKKKLKQTHLFDSSSLENGDIRRNPFAVAYKKGQQSGIRGRRKQKIVGTLNPWVQKVGTEKNLSMGASTSATKAQTSSPKENLKEKKRNWLEVQREIERREKEKKKEERKRKKAKLVEDKLKFAVFMKEWRKPREDLLCEDLKPLPKPVEINCQIPNELFGNFMMVLEFLNSFSSMFKVKITGGVTFELLENALVEEEMEGPIFDIIKLLLNTIFDLQVIEHEKPKSGVPIAVDLADRNYKDDLKDKGDRHDKDVTSQETVSQSVTATGWCEVFQGVSLHDIVITPFTITEILRLHLLNSGGRAGDTSKGLSDRGNFNLEDPGLWLRKEKSYILQDLGKHHISQLKVAEKLEILCCLVNQILTFATVREKVEERCEQARQARASVRSLQVAEIKLQKEAAARRTQEKKHAKCLVAEGLPQASSENAVFEIQRIEKEINKLKVDLQKKSAKLLPLAISGQLLPLGVDRAHRKFWLFSSLPGLFVEYNAYEVGPCLPEPTPRALELSDTLTHVRKLFEEESHNTSDKENDSSDRDVSKSQTSSVKKMLGEQNTSGQTLNISSESEKEDVISNPEHVNEEELLLCTASNCCPVHCSPISESRWYFFSQQSDVTALLGSLNDRGIRETALLRVLKQEEQRILELISQCPIYKLNPQKFADNELRKSARQHSGSKVETVQSKFPPHTPISYVMERHMRTNIMELEHKIFVGGIGSLKIRSRNAWIDAIDEGIYDKQCAKLVWGPKIENKKSSEQDEKEENAEKIVSSHEEQGEEKETEARRHSEEVKDYNSDLSDSEVSGVSAAVMYVPELLPEPLVDKRRPEKREDWKNGKNKKETKARKPKHHTREEQQSDSDHSDSEKSISIVYDKYFNNFIEERINTTEEETPTLERDVDTPKTPEEDSEDVSDLDDGSTWSIFPAHYPIVKDLACAILQIGQSLNPRCLKQPLADEGGKLISPMEHWEDSLMNTWNLSQLFIHYDTLESSINWTSSVYNSPCYTCDRRNHGKKMILCDGCNKRFHIFCIKPKLKSLPDGHWYCQDCATEESGSVKELSISNVSTRSTRAERKRKAESDNLDHDNNDASDSEEHRCRIQPAGDTCKKCAQTGDLIYCVTCSMGYHPECTNSSQISQQLKDNWLCECCKNKAQISPSDEISGSCTDKYGNDCEKETVSEEPDKSVDQTPETETFLQKDVLSSSSRERRGCVSASRAKIAAFTKRLRTNSWEDDAMYQTITDEDCMLNQSVKDTALPNRAYAVGCPTPSSVNVVASAAWVRKSNRGSSYASKDLPLDMAILDTLLTQLLDQECSWPFRRPVRNSQVPDYHSMIRRPMDLGTIKFKLNTAEYQSNEEFLKDILLVFKNCFMYNHQSTIEHKCGRQLMLFFEQRCEELGLRVNK